MTTTTSTVTSKGQITIPRTVRDRLGLRAGDRVLFQVDEAGTVTMTLAAASSLGRIPGLLGHLAGSRPVTVEEMDKAIRARQSVSDRPRQR